MGRGAGRLRRNGARLAIHKLSAHATYLQKKKIIMAKKKAQRNLVISTKGNCPLVIHSVQHPAVFNTIINDFIPLYQGIPP